MKALDVALDIHAMKPFESLQEWNRTLMNKVGQQVDLLERLNRLKRYLSPQIAETILESDDDNLFKSHRCEITAVFLDLRGFTLSRIAPNPRRSWHYLEAITRKWAS